MEMTEEERQELIEALEEAKHKPSVRYVPKKIYYFVNAYGKRKAFRKGVDPLCCICAHRESVSVIGQISYSCRKFPNPQRRYECKHFDVSLKLVGDKK